MVEAMQMAQDAQAGYACDYCTKRKCFDYMFRLFAQ